MLCRILINSVRIPISCGASRNKWGGRPQAVGSLGVALNAPKPDENPSGMRGNRDEAMTTNYVNLHKS